MQNVITCMCCKRWIATASVAIHIPSTCKVVCLTCRNQERRAQKTGAFHQPSLFGDEKDLPRARGSAI